MPKFLERQLKEEYGDDSAVPYKIMNSLGVMHGNTITAKGRALEAKHDRHAVREIVKRRLQGKT